MAVRYRISGYRARLALGTLMTACAVASATAGPADAATVDTSYDVCTALRSGASLAAVESNLEARGYTARNAGMVTGMTIRKRCPDQTAQVVARLKRAHG